MQARLQGCLLLSAVCEVPNLGAILKRLVPFLIFLWKLSRVLITQSAVRGDVGIKILRMGLFHEKLACSVEGKLQLLKTFLVLVLFDVFVCKAAVT